VTYIHANFNFVAIYKKLDKTANFFSVTLREIKDIRDTLHEIDGSEADAQKQKFRSC
jgi:hypothetical protein